MKKFYMLFLTFLTLGSFSMAQVIENFESLNMNLMLGDTALDKSTMKVVANPDSSAVDTSRYVVEFLRDKDGVEWDGFYATLETPVDLTANKYVHVKVWKPRVSTVMLKLEGGATPTEIEPMNPQAMTNEWEELVFDFSALTGEYTKIVFTPDRVPTASNTEDITMYFDDIFINNDPAVGSEPVQMIEDYEIITLNRLTTNSAEDLSTWTLVANPDKSPLNPSNYVVEFLRDKDAPTWAGFWSRLTDNQDSIDVTTNKFVHVKVWKPRISILRFKLESSEAGRTLEVPSISAQTKTEEWEDIVFDFSALTGKYPIIALIADQEDPLTLTEDITMYFDDIILNNIATPLEPIQQVFNVDMTNSGYTAGSKVWITGSFGGDHGNWAAPGTIPENEMLDPDGDGIYTITLNLPNGGYEYKFAWGDGWSHPDDGPGNRIYTVTGSAVLNHVWNVAGYTPVKELAGASFKVFPNPVTSQLTIQALNMKRLVVTDLLGRIIKDTKVQDLNSTQIELGDLQSGMYIISVETSTGTHTSKFLKQ